MIPEELVYLGIYSYLYRSVFVFSVCHGTSSVGSGAR